MTEVCFSKTWSILGYDDTLSTAQGFLELRLTPEEERILMLHALFHASPKNFRNAISTLPPPPPPATSFSGAKLG